MRYADNFVLPYVDFKIWCKVYEGRKQFTENPFAFY